MQIATCPSLPWFSGPEFFVELIFALIALIIGIYAYKVYKLSRQRSTILFGAGFFSIAFAYFIQAILNLLIFRNVMTQDIFQVVTGNAVMHSTLQLSVIATVSHMIFMTLGLALLAYVTLKERGIKILFLILSLSAVSLIFATNPLVVFYLLTSIFLLFITAQHYQRHDEVRSYSTLYVFLGFGMLFLGNLQLVFSSHFGIMYISGLIVLLIGYLLLMASLMRVVRK